MKKTAVSLTAILCSAVLLSGCANNNNANNKISPQAIEIADKYFAGDQNSFEAWKDIDREKIIAYVDGTDDPEFFNITFGEFFSEYMYYLMSYQISDDMSEDNKSACESYRDNIITYLTFERQYLYAGKAMYEISEDTLTDEQKNEIKLSSDAVKNDWASNFYTSCKAELGDNASEEEISAMCDEVLRAILQKCGLPDDTFYSWEKNRYLEELVIAEIVKDVTVTDDEVQEMLGELIEEAKDNVLNDTETYEQNIIYQYVYIPDGTRNARHIFLPYVVSSDKDKVKQEADVIAARIAEGESFDNICAEKDDEGTKTHIVLKNTASVPKEYTDALYSLSKPGDISDAVTTDSGVYFIQYESDAQISDDDVESVKAYIRSDLENNAETNAQNKEYSRWLDEYGYTIDYETLKLDKDTSILSSVDTTLYQ